MPGLTGTAWRKTQAVSQGAKGSNRKTDGRDERPRCAWLFVEFIPNQPLTDLSDNRRSLAGTALEDDLPSAHLPSLLFATSSVNICMFFAV